MIQVLFSSPIEKGIQNCDPILLQYDQMIKSEDDKLSQVLKKIQQQKEALNKHLKGEIFSLEMKKRLDPSS